MGIPSPFVAYVAAAVVAWIGLKLHWLDRGGAVAAMAVGGTIFAFGGWWGAALLLAFFIPSSLLSRLPKQGPGRLGPAASARKEPRRGRQVLANGAIAALAAFSTAPAVRGALPVPGWAELAFAGSLAAVTADTWASEIGRFFGQIPRSAITLRALEPGESGGMTPVGTFAGMMGAAWIGWLAAWIVPGFGVKEALVLEAAGFLGMWADSLLGASLQFKGECGVCGRSVEDPNHPHGLANTRGLRFFDNDVVNVFAAAIGATIAVCLGLTS